MKRLAVAACLALVTAALVDAAQVRRLPQNPTQRNRADIRLGQVMLAADRIRADRWYPPGTLSDGGRELSRAADMDLLLLASAHVQPALRRVAVREFGRFETPENAEFIARFLEDEDPTVRMEAADALVQTLVERPDLAATAAIQPIDLRLIRETDPKVVVAFWKALVQLPLGNEVSIRLERQFLNEIQQQTPLRMEAGLVLVDLLWNLRGRAPLAQTVQSLREWLLLGAAKGGMVQIGTSDVGMAVTFLEGLWAAKVDDDLVLERVGVSTDNLLRYRAVEMHNPHNPQHRERLERMARGTDLWTRDPAILRLLENPAVPLCDLLPLTMSPAVEIRMIEALGARKGTAVPECGDWSPDRALLALAQRLPEAKGPREWQAPARALEALARRLPSEAGALVRTEAITREEWMIRAAAARIAGAIEDSETAVQLAEDPQPNVRADALVSLRALKHPLLPALAVNALEHPDYHLVRTAAQVLQELDGPAVLLPPLMAALDRLTKQGKDTSREPRLALLARIKEMSLRSPDDGNRWAVTLETYLEDFDPVIAQEAAGIISAVSGRAVEPRPRFRPIAQPTEGELQRTPGCVVVDFDHADDWRVTLDRARAPIATTRFWLQAEEEYYNGQAVWRADEALVELGSPGANEYVTLPRFIRDEMGGDVRAGAVVLQGFGRDTLDGRLMYVRKDRRDLDRRHTVLGHVPLVALDSPLSRPVLPGNTVIRISQCPQHDSQESKIPAP